MTRIDDREAQPAHIVSCICYDHGHITTANGAINQSRQLVGEFPSLYQILGLKHRSAIASAARETNLWSRICGQEVDGLHDVGIHTGVGPPGLVRAIRIIFCLEIEREWMFLHI